MRDEWDAGDFLGDWWKEDPDNWTDQQLEEAYRGTMPRTSSSRGSDG